MRNQIKHGRVVLGNREHGRQDSKSKPGTLRAMNRRKMGRGLLESLEDRRVLAGDVAAGMDRMPPELLPGTVYGRKWEDLNGDGRATDDEPGLAGVPIYADLNRNGQLDANEPQTRTQADDPTTRVDETGNYVLKGVPQGRQWIREVVPRGFKQTYPHHLNGPRPTDPLPIDLEPVDPAADEFAHVEPRELTLELMPGEMFVTEVSITINPYCIRAIDLDIVSSDPDRVRVENLSGVQLNGCGGDTSFFKVGISADRAPVAFKLLIVDTLGGGEYGSVPVSILGSGEPVPVDAHVVDIPPGEAVKGIDFGNRRVGGASIEGRKWLDRNGNGQQDGGEVGQGGVQIYLDLNRDGQWNRNEPITITGEDVPETDFDEGGLYRFEGLRAGDYLVREIVPRNFVQTYPGVAGVVLNSETRALHHGIAIDLDVTAVTATQSDAAIPNSLAAKLAMTVVWPDSCGALIEGASAATVVGDHIIISLAGHQEGDFCAEVISAETTRVEVDGLHTGVYDVIVVLNEDLRDGQPRTTTLTTIAQIEVGGPGGHMVSLAENELVSDVNFGNYSTLRPGSIRGIKWLDANGNGRRDRGEEGLAGVTIYVDANHNMQWDRDEPYAVTMKDDSATAFDETGQYLIEGIEPGWYEVREVVPDGYQQTFPHPWIAMDLLPPGLADVILGAPLPHLWPFPGGSHWIHLPSGGAVKGLDFGNQPIPRAASVAGVTWVDEDGNGKQADSERGLPGVVVYADLNNNGRYEVGEPATRSGRDDPATAADESGRYLLSGLRPGEYTIREVLPFGFQQTFPLAGSQILHSGSEDLPPGSALDFQLTSAAGSMHDGIPGGELTFEVTWRNGCGVLLHDQVQVDSNGDAITVVLAGTQVGQICTQALVTETITVAIPEPPAETYQVRALLRESESPNEPLADSFILHAVVSTGQRGGHAVVLTAGDARTGIDFGNRKNDEFPPPGVGPIADIDGDGRLDALDIDALAAAIRSGKAETNAHDLSGDGAVDQADYLFLVETLMQTQYGDSNLDGIFDSSDLVKAFQAGKYEDGNENDTTWEEGDWNGDGKFTTADLVAAFQRGTYEGGTGAISAVAADNFWQFAAAMPRRI